MEFKEEIFKETIKKEGIIRYKQIFKKFIKTYLKLAKDENQL